jgi:hypothetical protein
MKKLSFILAVTLLASCSTLKESPSTNMKITQSEGNYDINDCEEDWSIAQVENLPNKAAEQKINSFLMSKISEKSCDHAEDVSGEEYGLKIIPDKVFPNYLLIESHASFNTGGPESKINSTCIVFDLNNGDRVEFESLLTENYQTVVEDMVVAQLWEGKKGEYEEYKHVLSASKKPLVEIASHKVCPTGNGLILMFSTLEIAPASFKNPEIQVGLKEWHKIFKVTGMTKELFGDEYK